MKQATFSSWYSVFKTSRKVFRKVFLASSFSWSSKEFRNDFVTRILIASQELGWFRNSPLTTDHVWASARFDQLRAFEAFRREDEKKLNEEFSKSFFKKFCALLVNWKSVRAHFELKYDWTDWPRATIFCYSSEHTINFLCRWPCHVWEH